MSSQKEFIVVQMIVTHLQMLNMVVQI